MSGKPWSEERRRTQKRPDLAQRNRDSAKHGHCRNHKPSSTFKTWGAMLDRSHFGNCKAARLYLDKGITVCERWLTFVNFLEDMGERPVGTSIDRIDGTKGYSPDNCRWATNLEQALNKRTAHRLTAFGRTQHITEWARELGTSHQALIGRLKDGWTVEETLSKPIKKYKPRGSRQRAISPAETSLEGVRQ